MVRFTVTIERSNGTRFSKDFTCPRERREWILKIKSMFPKDTKIIHYGDDVYIDDEHDSPPEDEAHWYELKGGW